MQKMKLLSLFANVTVTSSTYTVRQKKLYPCWLYNNLMKLRSRMSTFC